MRVLVTGGAGLVAGWLARTAPDGVDLHVTERRTPVSAAVRERARVHRIDLVDERAAARLVASVRPEVVVHTAYGPTSEPDIVTATGSVVRAAAAAGADLVHLSTDVVFSGADPPYREGDAPDPVSEYGRRKAIAEGLVRDGAGPTAAIVRTSLVVSLDPPDRATAGLLAGWGRGEPARLFHDELRQPVRAEDLAAELWALVGVPPERRGGVWHLPGPEKLSRLVLGQRLAARLGLGPVPVLAVAASDLPEPRPRDPELVSTRRGLLGVPLRVVDD